MGSPNIFRRMGNAIKSFFIWFFRRKLAIILFILVSLALPAYVLYFTVYLPARTARHLVDPEKIAPKDTLSIPSVITPELAQKIALIGSLELEQAYIKNRLSLSQLDSVYMAVNLDDSLVTLEIKGVVVRSCMIREFHVSRRLGTIDHEQLLHWLSTPFDLKSALATIPKIPYVIKAAPKDTLEAQAQSSIPLPADTTTVYFTLFFNKDLVIEVEQTDPPNETDEMLVESYFETKNKDLRHAALQAALQGHAMEQDIYIRLRVSAADARAIYRGIPVNAAMVLKLD